MDSLQERAQPRGVLRVMRPKSVGSKSGYKASRQACGSRRKDPHGPFNLCQFLVGGTDGTKPEKMQVAGCFWTRICARASISADRVTSSIQFSNTMAPRRLDHC